MKKRITVNEALQHPYLSELHFPEDEPTRDSLSKLDFEFEEHSLTLQQLKDLIYEEILIYHFPDFVEQQEIKKQKGESIIAHILANENGKIKESSDEDQNEDSD